MLRRTMNFKLKPGVTRAQRDCLERVISQGAEHIPALHECVLGTNLNGAADREYVWELLAEDILSVRAHPYHDNEMNSAIGPVVQALDVAYSDPIDVQVPHPGLRNVVKVTMLVELSDGVSDEIKREYEETNIASFIKAPQLRNQVLSRAVAPAGPISAAGPERWTHVVEQECASLSDLEEYLNSPVHRAIAEKWRFSHPTVISNVRRVVYQNPSSILAWYERIVKAAALEGDG